MLKPILNQSTFFHLAELTVPVTVTRRESILQTFSGGKKDEHKTVTPPESARKNLDGPLFAQF
jgi:hypothetical protein